MSSSNERLAGWGRLIVRWRHAVVLAWALVAALSLWTATSLPERLQSGSGSIPGSTSAAAEAALRTRFDNPFAFGLAVTLQVPGLAMEGPQGRALVASTAEALRRHPEVSRVLAPGDRGSRTVRSSDPHGAILLVGLRARDLAQAERAVPQVRALVGAHLAQEAPTRPVTWHVTGRPALTHDINIFSTLDSARAEARSLPLTAVVLLIAFGSLLATALPLVVGTAAIVCTSGLLVVATGVLPLSTLTQSVASMLGLALGIDYALLMVSRFREEMRRGEGVEAAVARTTATAGRAVVISGATVLIGFGGLVTTSVLDARSLGVGGLIVAGVSVVAALTLLPALLGFAGTRLVRSRWTWSPGRWAGLWTSWLEVVVRHPWRFGLGAAGVLLAMAYPATTLQAGFPTGRWMPAALPYQQGFDALRSMGQGGLVAPIDLVLQVRDGTEPAVSAARVPSLLAYSRRLRQDPRVAQVLSPVDLDPPLPASVLTWLYARPELVAQQQPLWRELYLSHDRRSTLVQVVLADHLTFEQSKAFAAELAATPPGGYDVLVGGQAAYYLDFDREMAATIPRVVGLVVVATLVTMALAYRSVLVPVKAVVLNLLSVGAGLGAVVAIFQWGWGSTWLGHSQPLDHVPLTVSLSLFCIVFGLSMDYEVFLLSRIKEAYDRGEAPDRATVEGIAATARLVTSAAAVMVCVFGAFGAAEFAVVQMLGVGLAVAVAVDATLVRLVLLPATMALLADANWWPGGRRPLSRAPSDVAP